VSPSGCASACCDAVSERCPLPPGELTRGASVFPWAPRTCPPPRWGRVRVGCPSPARGEGICTSPCRLRERGHKPSHGTITEKSDLQPPRRHGWYRRSSRPAVHNGCRGQHLAVGESTVPGERALGCSSPDVRPHGGKRSSLMWLFLRVHADSRLRFWGHRRSGNTGKWRGTGEGVGEHAIGPGGRADVSPHWRRPTLPKPARRGRSG
jgi:hypothetical protein